MNRDWRARERERGSRIARAPGCCIDRDSSGTSQTKKKLRAAAQSITGQRRHPFFCPRGERGGVPGRVTHTYTLTHTSSLCLPFSPNCVSPFGRLEIIQYPPPPPPLSVTQEKNSQRSSAMKIFPL
jgi:hypothetical protein